MSDFILPSPFSEISREPLLFGPSPIHLLDRITSDLGGKCKVWTKREDCNSALAFGGNKTRKLEYLLADALALGKDTLVSIGGIQSNHTRQVAAVAAKYGLQAKLIQEHLVDWPDPVYDKVGNIQLSRLMGSEPQVNQKGPASRHTPTLAQLAEEVSATGGKPYVIPSGASDHPLGGLGYARWAFEVVQQEKELGVFFHVIITPVASGATLAGMIAGFKYLEKLRPELQRRRVIGIDASAKPQQTRDTVLRIAKVTAEKIGLSPNDITAADVILDERYNAGCYGIPDTRTIEAIKYGARMDAFITDPVYVGKSLAGMLDMIRRGEISSGNVLFTHTGGQLVLSAYPGMEAPID
ncbi:hypothetical protein FGG08_006485 [Glutinoglossum americanum]|uniref:Tryptophan synthase beta chain-like PALP domain-containing protein n=1 Tax=Glutinoglossum americanum TaxID=1670608 RepID=A0A9P8HVY6_9PEZI|nr:hypothetical protein FGG08_006485 [Glutinoglossum americanum]